MLDPHTDRDFAARVIAIIATHAGEGGGVDRAKVVADAPLASLGFDSFGVVSLLFALEEEFDVEISDEQLRELRTVGDVVVQLRHLCVVPSTAN
jgi:acyl carrier protein